MAELKEEKEKQTDQEHRTYAKRLFEKMGPGKPKAMGYMAGGRWELFGETWIYIICGKIKFTPLETDRARLLNLVTDDDGYVWNPTILHEWLSLNRDLVPAEIKTPADFVAYVKKNKVRAQPLLSIIHGIFADHDMWCANKNDETDKIVLPSIVKAHFDLLGDKPKT